MTTAVATSTGSAKPRAEREALASKRKNILTLALEREERAAEQARRAKRAQVERECASIDSEEAATMERLRRECVTEAHERITPLLAAWVRTADRQSAAEVSSAWLECAAKAEALIGSDDDVDIALPVAFVSLLAAENPGRALDIYNAALGAITPGSGLWGWADITKYGVAKQAASRRDLAGFCDALKGLEMAVSKICHNGGGHDVHTQARWEALTAGGRPGLAALDAKLAEAERARKMEALGATVARHAAEQERIKSDYRGPSRERLEVMSAAARVKAGAIRVLSGVIGARP